jgi:2,4-dienoyl-CoA reductase-like NADH-dependent reductase (Old Yellow Enzyme family)/thioredoxin reductase
VIDRLFEPLRLGPVELPNRIVSTAHQTTMVEHNLPTDDFVAYHEARARGGVGLIVLEATAPHPGGLLTAHELAGYLPAIVPAYRRVADAVQPHGTRLFVQLLDGGREQISGPPRMPALAPSPVPSQRFRAAPRALRPHEIEDLVAGFAASAALAAEGGLDGVEISGAHGYLVAQFFDPELNRRDDEWGDPSLFLLRIVHAVREAAPGLALGVRLSADAPAAQAAAALVAGEVDYLSLALGASDSYLASTLIVPPPPLPDNLIERHLTPFRVAPALIATSRVFDAAEAGRIVASGAADAIGMTRALIVDPDMPAKAREGRLDEIVRCIGCQACIAHYHAGEAVRCAVNPRTGRERAWTAAVRAARPRHLLVVGAGPAGLAAAAEGLASGHRVTLLERAGRVGGQQALAAASPGGGSIAIGLMANFRRALAAVDLLLDTEATPEKVQSLVPDAVVVATGARPYAPPLPLDGSRVAQAWDALAEPGAFPGSVVIADWGGDPAGVNVAEALAVAGARVTLCVASVAFGESVHQYRRNLYLQRLYRAGVEIRMHLELAGATGGTAVFRNAFAPELETSLGADWLVLALGRVPEDTLGPSLASAGLRVEEAGDCLSPRSFEEAIMEGTLAARRVFA